MSYDVSSCDEKCAKGTKPHSVKYLIRSLLENIPVSSSCGHLSREELEIILHDEEGEESSIGRKRLA